MPFSILTDPWSRQDRWHNLTTRFIIVGAVLNFLLLGIGVVVGVVGNQVEKDSRAIEFDAAPGTIGAVEMQAALSENFQEVAFAFTNTSAKERNLHLAQIDSTDTRFEKARQRYSTTMTINEPMDRLILENFLDRRATYLRVREEFVEALSSRKISEAERLFNKDLLAAFRDAEGAGRKLMEYNHGKIKRFSGEISNHISTLKDTIIIFVVVALLVAGYLAAEFMLRRREILMMNEQLLRFATAASVARVVIWVRDLETGKIEWTDLIDEVLGYEPGGAPNTLASLMRTVHPEDLGRVRDSFSHAEEGKEAIRTDYRVKRETGEYIWVRVTANIRKGKLGAPAAMYGSMRDITSEHKAEQAALIMEAQLRQSQKLEAVGALAGGIAHDFNNILTGINGTAELQLMDMHESKAPASYITGMETILQCGRRARDLIGQILAFSRKQESNKQPVAIPAIVAEVTALVRSTTPANISFSVENLDDAPLVKADSTQIHQVLLNICTNGIHAMRGKNGTLAIKVATLVADADFLQVHAGMSPGRYVRISISDTGIGMDGMTQKRIFEPFFTTKPAGEGTGLGLSVVHGIVRDHGGGIFAYSKLGEGTVFHVYLPALIEEGVGVQNTDLIAGSPRGNGERILLVDDEGVIGRVSSDMLTRSGYFVKHVTDPKDALRLIREEPSAHDALVTDLQMPGMSGLELAAAVRKIKWDMPIVLMSGFVGTSTASSFREVGVDELVMKPLTVSSLASAVNQAFKDRKVD